MDKLSGIHEQAIKMTKQKIHEDILEYMGEKERLPAFRTYLSDRRHYIEELWINIWLNEVKKFVSKSDKKIFLEERGFEVKDEKRKLMNQLFENEVRTYLSFHALQWLEESFSDGDEKWEMKYGKARAKFLRFEEKRLIINNKKTLEKQILVDFKEWADQNKMRVYLPLRYEVAKELIVIFDQNKKFEIVEEDDQPKEVGGLFSKDYDTMSDLFSELTGNVSDSENWHFYIEYETYDAILEPFIRETTFERTIHAFMNQMNESILYEYKDVFNHSLTKTNVMDIVDSPLWNLSSSFFTMIQEEYVTDLIELVKVPFNFEEHLEHYQNAISEREEKKRERVLIIQRKKEQERRIVEDIFGREYNPPLGRAIHYVLHIGETNTGKTHHALRRMKEVQSGLYLAPLRLLALEVYDKLNAEGVPCSLKTGEEEKEVEGANHISSTVEMFHEKDTYDVIVIDEAQMIADKDRGFSWYKAITKANAKEVHIIGSINSRNMILQLLGDSRVDVNEYERDIPLQVEKKEFNLRQTKKGDALVCFSRRRVLETASNLENAGHRVSMIYGSMPPETRKKQIQRFINQETKVIVATDAIGMGLNLPIRRIVFLENEKFDGTRRRRLTSQEVKQIAGRAGRKGIYDVGKVAFTKDIKRMKSLLRQEDIPVQTFAIAPTSAIFERFQKYYRDLGTFFELWDKFESPNGTKKASLYEEKELYEIIRGTEIDIRLPMMDLYGFLHLPFSQKESLLIHQWRGTMMAIVKGYDLPEPKISRKSLEDLELAYKSIGLHLLFLYRLGRKTEAIYWERLREELSDEVHESLKKDVKKFSKKCRRCGSNLPYDFHYPICNKCHALKYRRKESFKSFKNKYDDYK